MVTAFFSGLTIGSNVGDWLMSHEMVVLRWWVWIGRLLSLWLPLLLGGDSEDDELDTFLGSFLKYKMHNCPMPIRAVRLFSGSYGEYQNKCSASQTWEQIRVQWPKVIWSHLIWFKQEVPRYSFITWLALKNRLSTGDRMQGLGNRTTLHVVRRTRWNKGSSFVCMPIYLLDLVSPLWGSSRCSCNARLDRCSAAYNCRVFSAFGLCSNSDDSTDLSLFYLERAKRATASERLCLVSTVDPPNWQRHQKQD